MTSEEFVDCFVKEKKNLLRLWLHQSEVASKIAQLGLPAAKMPLLSDILDQALTDAFYTVLLGLDGAASIGDRQEMYELRDSKGNVLTGGDIEGHAWERFHGPSSGVAR